MPTLAAALAAALLASPAAGAPPHVDLLTPADAPSQVFVTPEGDGLRVDYTLLDRGLPSAPWSDADSTLYAGHLDQNGRLLTVRARGLIYVLARHPGLTLAAQCPHADARRGRLCELVQWSDRPGGGHVERRIELPEAPGTLGETDLRAAWDPARDAWIVAWTSYHQVPDAPPRHVYGAVRLGWLDPAGAWLDARGLSPSRGGPVPSAGAGIGDGGAALVITPTGPVLLWRESVGGKTILQISRLAPPGARDGRPLVVDPAIGVGRAALAANADGALLVVWVRPAKPRAGDVHIGDGPNPAVPFSAVHAAIIEGERITPLGRIGGHGDSVRAASDGRGFLAAWMQPTRPRETDVFIAPVRHRDGAWRASPTRLTRSPAPYNTTGGLAFDGRRYALGVIHGLDSAGLRIYLLDPAARYTLPFVPAALPARPSPPDRPATPAPARSDRSTDR